jgi:hypothetical protein
VTAITLLHSIRIKDDETGVELMFTAADWRTEEKWLPVAERRLAAAIIGWLRSTHDANGEASEPTQH